MNPGTFPCRLDMEIRACGAKRWVDLKGRPATPWQFINFRRGREETESAAVTTGSTPISALDGLITCGNCGHPMFLDDTQGDQEASYACQPGPGDRWDQCPTPRLNARRAEALLIGKALRTVLTDETISKVLAVVNDVQRYDEARQHSLTRQDLQEVREDPERFVLASGRAAESGERGVPTGAPSAVVGLVPGQGTGNSPGQAVCRRIRKELTVMTSAPPGPAPSAGRWSRCGPGAGRPSVPGSTPSGGH